MKILDLFSGIGGFSLGLEKAGHEIVAFCEINDFSQRVLKKHWPKVSICKDVVRLRKFLEKLELSLAVSPAKILASQDSAKGFSLTNPPEKPEAVVDCFGRTFVSFAWYAIEERGGKLIGSWRTWQQSMTDTWEVFSERWPKAGIMRNGIAYRREGLEGGICEKDSIVLPTPTTSDYKGASSGCKKIKNKEISMLRYFLHYHYAPPPHEDQLPKPFVIGGNDGVRNRAHRTRALGNTVDPELVYELGKNLCLMK
jgi:hypothetical protein